MAILNFFYCIMTSKYRIFWDVWKLFFHDLLKKYNFLQLWWPKIIQMVKYKWSLSISTKISKHWLFLEQLAGIYLKLSILIYNCIIFLKFPRLYFCFMRYCYWLVWKINGHNLNKQIRTYKIDLIQFSKKANTFSLFNFQNIRLFLVLTAKKYDLLIYYSWY